MKRYNISKYTPDKWDENGHCWDWIAIGDIGREFNGKVLTTEEYKRIEDNYIKALYYVLDYFKITNLKLKDVGRNSGDETFCFYAQQKDYAELYNDELLQLYKNVAKMKRLKYEDIGNYCRLQLREDIWGKAFCPRKLGIFICYDFILGLKCSRSIDEIIPKINKLGLVVEKGD